MAYADLDAVIRKLAKQQHRAVMVAAKKRSAWLAGLAAKAKSKDGKERCRQLAKETLLQAEAAARRLQLSADNAADSYARAMRQATVAADAAAAASKAAAEARKKPAAPNKKTAGSKPKASKR